MSHTRLSRFARNSVPILGGYIDLLLVGSRRKGLPGAQLFAEFGRVKSAVKILDARTLPEWRQQMRQRGIAVVATNGCFDILHAGHVTYLEAARNLGGALIVGINADESVRALKGAGRPLNPAPDRALVLAALEAVDAVFVFDDVRATRFLAAAQPDIYVKGGDYTVDTLDQDERRTVETNGGRIEIIPFVPGKSTTGILKKMKAE